MDTAPTHITRDKITLRQPRKTDGAAVWELIASCHPLDENSMYCNLLQCDHFAETCVVAERGGAVVGWVSGYLKPGDPTTLFVWQVAVSDKARGEGLGRRMLQALLMRDACAEVRHLQTTITPDNDASWGLFSSLARHAGGSLEHETHFCRDRHFAGAHETERMVTITFPEPLRRAA